MCVWVLILEEEVNCRRVRRRDQRPLLLLRPESVGFRSRDTHGPVARELHCLVLKQRPRRIEEFHIKKILNAGQIEQRQLGNKAAATDYVRYGNLSSAAHCDRWRAKKGPLGVAQGN